MIHQKRLPGLLLGALLGVTPLAHAGIKCWLNKDGVRECGNVVPPEYSQQPSEVKSKSGLTLRTQSAARTPEEVVADREAKEAVEKEAAAKLEVERRKQLGDKVLLDTFASEDDLILARDGKLQSVDAQIKVTESHIHKLDKSLDQMVSQAGDIERRGKPVPADLAHSISDTRVQIEEQKVFIAKQRAEQDNIKAKYEADIVRFRQLRGKR